MNNITIVGNSARDAETRSVNTANGAVTVCNFTVMVNRTNKKDSPADAFRCAIWGKYAEAMAPYIKKGTKLAVSGSVYATAYVGSDGTPKATLELSVRDMNILGQPKAQPVYADPSTAPAFTPVEYNDENEATLPW